MLERPPKPPLGRRYSPEPSARAVLGSVGAKIPWRFGLPANRPIILTHPERPLPRPGPRRLLRPDRHARLSCWPAAAMMLARSFSVRANRELLYRRIREGEREEGSNP